MLRNRWIDFCPDSPEIPIAKVPIIASHLYYIIVWRNTVRLTVYHSFFKFFLGSFINNLSYTNEKTFAMHPTRLSSTGQYVLVRLLIIFDRNFIAWIVSLAFSVLSQPDCLVRSHRCMMSNRKVVNFSSMCGLGNLRISEQCFG